MDSLDDLILVSIHWESLLTKDVHGTNPIPLMFTPKWDPSQNGGDPEPTGQQAPKW